MRPGMPPVMLDHHAGEEGSGLSVPEPGVHRPEEIAISVVMPTYRRIALMKRCLESLVQQELDSDIYEIIVADDAACPETRQHVEEIADWARPIVRYVPVSGPAHGPAAARNAGWRAARGRVIAFTDDDTIPDPRWLERGLDAMAGNVDALWGRIVMPLPERPTDYEKNESGLETAEFATANCFCRRSALEETGGFDERFRVAWREDADLFFSLLRSGRTVVRAPEAIVLHPVRPAPWGISLRQQRKSMYNALLYKKHPELYRQRIQRSPPLGYYAIVLSLLGGAVALASGRRTAALAAMVPWGVFTTRFCMRRLKGTSRAAGHIAEMAVTSALIPPLSVFWRIRGGVRFRVFFF